LAHDFFIAVAAYGADAVPLRQQFTIPSLPFDCQHHVKDCSGGHTFDALDFLVKLYVGMDCIKK